ncbi:MAG: YIP1 family protein [Desulfobacterales bacterium]|nr:YIP1 family protein [Desulfobacterales bacterium]
MLQTENFSLGFYFHALTKLLGEPRKFFSELPRDAGLKRPLGFLCVSSLFFAGASLMSNQPPNPVIMGGVFFINAMGMTVIAAGIGYMAMTMIMGRQVTFTRFFSIYALSAGVTLLASWLPFFIWLTEPWKWWLIGTGMVKGCGFKLIQVLVIIGVSMGVMFLLFWSVLPVISLRG